MSEHKADSEEKSIKFNDNVPLCTNLQCIFYVLSLLQAYYFDRDDVALKGFSNIFKKSSDEEREHAEKFMKYQSMRGGRIVLQPIQVRGLAMYTLWQSPGIDPWGISI